MRADDFHGHVRMVLDVLRDTGSKIPERAPKELCQEWVSEGWLNRDPADDGGAVYSLSAASIDALTWTDQLARRRSVTVTQVNAILGQIATMANSIDPDREAAIRRAEATIAEQQAEIERLRAGGDLETVSLDEFVEQVDEIERRMSDIPADFRSVAEDFKAGQRGILEKAMTGGTRPGDIMSAAARGWNQTMQTRSGRSFQGVVDILRDPRSMAALRTHIGRIMSHEFAAMLHPRERASFADIAAVFDGNVSQVLEWPRKTASVINAALTRHSSDDSANGLGIDEALRAAREALWNYPKRSLPAGLIPGLPRVECNPVMLELYDPRPVPEPDLLDDLPASDAVPLSLKESRLWGGPHSDAVRAHLWEVLGTADSVTLGEVWAFAPDDLRRSVELISYYDILHESGSDDLDVSYESSPDAVAAERPDGALSMIKIDTIRISSSHQNSSHKPETTES